MFHFSPYAQGDEMRRWTKSLWSIAVVLALSGLLAPASAQDSHYWAEQYGTRASLLGGAIIGSVRDLSAAYYNPGSAALHDEAGFVISGRAYRSGTIRVVEGAGDGIDLANTTQRPIPTLLATPIDFDFLGRHVLLYSALTRQDFGASFSTIRVEDADVLPAPGDESFSAALRIDASLRETWTGVTWAYPFADWLGVGVSQFLAIRSQSGGSRLLAQAATQAGDVGILTRVRDRSYTHYRTLTKVGVMVERGALSIGLTATTPSVAISGEGSTTFNGSAAGIDADGDGAADQYLAVDLQSGIPASFRSGWATGAGLGVRFASTQLHASAEWFESAERWTILDADPVVPEVGSEAPTMDATAEFGSVFNWGFGIEQGVRFATLYGGIASDRSAGVPGADRATDVTISNYDLLRYSGGVSATIGRVELMLGLGYTSGSQPLPPPADGGVLPEPGGTRLEYSQWTVVLGFEFTSGGADSAN